MPGRVVALTPRQTLRVVHLYLPRPVLALEGHGLVRQTLPPAGAIITRPEVALVSGFRPDAAAWIWTNGAEWNLRIGDGAARPLRDGDAFEVYGHTLRTVLIPLAEGGGATTLGPALDLEPLEIEARFDVVHLRRGTAPPLTLTGQAARVISELVLLGGTASWEVLAGELWRGETDRDALRKKFDVCLVRLRKRLRKGRVRPDLVRALGTGVIELVLHPTDRVIEAC